MSITADTRPISYLTEENTLRSWLLTTDHKRIALLYLTSITVFFFLGGVAAALMRLNLLTPTGAIVSHEMYNRLFPMHGVVMVWFFLVPAIPVTLGNFIVPLMLGARDLAFPKLNLISWYLFMSGGIFATYSLFAGGLDTGWTGHDLPQKRSRRTSRTNDPAWPGTSPELPRPRQIDHSGSARTALLTTTLPHRSADPRALTSASVDDE